LAAEFASLWRVWSAFHGFSLALATVDGVRAAWLVGDHSVLPHALSPPSSSSFSQLAASVLLDPLVAVEWCRMDRVFAAPAPVLEVVTHALSELFVASRAQYTEMHRLAPRTLRSSFSSSSSTSPASHSSSHAEHAAAWAADLPVEDDEMALLSDRHHALALRSAGGAGASLGACVATIVLGQEVAFVQRLLRECAVLVAHSASGSACASASSASAALDSALLPRARALEQSAVAFRLLHQWFIAHPVLVRAVHWQGYEAALVPLLMAGVPSMHLCLDFAVPLLDRALRRASLVASAALRSASPAPPAHDVSRCMRDVTFAVLLTSFVVQAYPVERSMRVCQQALGLLRTSPDTIARVLAWEAAGGIGGSGGAGTAPQPPAAAHSLLDGLVRMAAVFPPLTPAVSDILLQLRTKIARLASAKNELGAVATLVRMAFTKLVRGVVVGVTVASVE
jgi:hypothetical protein